MKSSEAKRRTQRAYEKKTNFAAQKKYMSARGTGFSMKFISPQDDDILQQLQTVPSKAGYIKKLIREDLKGKGK